MYATETLEGRAAGYDVWVDAADDRHRRGIFGYEFGRHCSCISFKSDYY